MAIEEKLWEVLEWMYEQKEEIERELIKGNPSKDERSLMIGRGHQLYLDMYQLEKILDQTKE